MEVLAEANARNSRNFMKRFASIVEKVEGPLYRELLSRDWNDRHICIRWDLELYQDLTFKLKRRRELSVEILRSVPALYRGTISQMAQQLDNPLFELYMYVRSPRRVIATILKIVLGI